VIFDHEAAYDAKITDDKITYTGNSQRSSASQTGPFVVTKASIDRRSGAWVEESKTVSNGGEARLSFFGYCVPADTGRF
jgi:hypothetical protein